MTEPLFIVENKFTIESRGLVLVGITLEQYGTVNVGDRVSIRRPRVAQLRRSCGPQAPET